MRLPNALFRRFHLRPTAGTGSLLLLLLVVALTGLAIPPATLRAGPYDLKAFAGADVKDLTLDATEGVLYFSLRGTAYVYRPRSIMAGPVSLAELMEAIRFSETLLIEEANPRATADYYDGRTGRVLSRILVRPCLPAGKR